MPRLLPALLLALSAGSAQAARRWSGSATSVRPTTPPSPTWRSDCRRFGLEVRGDALRDAGSTSSGPCRRASSTWPPRPPTAAIANRAHGGRILVVAGLAKGGARLVGRTDLPLKAVADLKGHASA